MQRIAFLATTVFFCSMLSSCSTLNSGADVKMADGSGEVFTPQISSYYGSKLPARLDTGEKTVVVNPRGHVWGAYDASGTLIKAGTASAGANWCKDIGQPCRTDVGQFRIFFLGDESCESSLYPIPKGGAPMPYCMFFNGYQAIHGSPNVVKGNISHGCVRTHKWDAEWLRYNFVEMGTKVIILPY